MFVILVVSAVVFLLVAIGTPYGQTWYGRWHG